MLWRRMRSIEKESSLAEDDESGVSKNARAIFCSAIAARLPTNRGVGTMLDDNGYSAFTRTQSSQDRSRIADPNAPRSDSTRRPAWRARPLTHKEVIGGARRPT